MTLTAVLFAVGRGFANLSTADVSRFFVQRVQKGTEGFRFKVFLQLAARFH